MAKKNKNSGFLNEKKQGKIRGLLKTVDQTTLKIQEADQISKIEITNPSLQEILQQLEQGECTLFFYKITDGSLRRMRCTLEGVNPVASKYNRTGTVVIWDLDANEWRSCYANRVFKLIRNEKTDIQ
jgi:uncharacterized protein YwgA